MNALSHSELAARLDAFSRVVLGVLPTPLTPLPRLGQELGRGVWIKRDDELGPGLGGNKTRKLEYLMAEALDSGHRRVVTFGGLQSNHARITAAVARRLGLEPHLFYFHRRPRELRGNLLLNRLLGARMHFVPVGGEGGRSRDMERTQRLVRALARLRVGPHYFIPVGGHSWVGCMGYVRAALELDQQVRSAGLERPWLVVAAGTGGTLAGLLAGLTLLASPIRVVGIDVGALWKGFPGVIAHMAQRLCARLGGTRYLAPEAVPVVERTYVGRAYGVPTPAGGMAIRKLARLEGIALDPVYTGKAFAGLLDLLPTGALGDRDPVIFLHTGGAPSLFAWGVEGCLSENPYPGPLGPDAPGGSNGSRGSAGLRDLDGSPWVLGAGQPPPPA